MKKIIYSLLIITSTIAFGQSGVRTVTFTNPAPIIVDGTPTITNATGFGKSDGSINISFGNGTYTYTWTKDPSTTTTPTALIPTPDWNKLGAGYYTITANSGGCSSAPYPFTITEPPKLTPIISGNTMISCYNGTTTLTASAQGGLLNTYGSYSYAWDITYLDNSKDSKTGVEVTGRAGEYILTVYDNAIPPNSKSTSLTINEKPLLTSSKNIINVKCKGDSTGAVTLTLGGGSGYYNVIWENSSSTSITRTGLIEGTYNYTVTDATDSGCFITGSAIVTEPSQLIVNTINQTLPTSVNAQDGSISINASGGTGSYTYYLKKDNITNNYATNIITNLENGIYEVWVKDANSCISSSKTIALEALKITVISKEDIKCYGTSTGTIIVTASGGEGSGYNFQWYRINGSVENILTNETNASLSGLNAGIYRIKVSDNINPVIFTDITLSEPALPLTASVTHTNPNCFGGIDGTATIVVSGGTPDNGNYTYEWKKDENLLPITIANPKNLSAGNYKVLIKDELQCSFEVTFSITDPSTITLSTPAITNINIFNQNTGAITFQSDPTGGNGGYIYKWTFDKDNSFSKSTRDITALKAGKYQLEITDSKSCSITKKYEIGESTPLTVNIKTSKPIKCNGDSNGELTAEVEGGIAPYKYVWKKNGQVLTGENNATISNLGFGSYSVYVTDTANPEPTGPFAQAQQLNYTLTQPNKLTVSLTNQTNVLCYGDETGAINIAINGGTAPYIQQWTKDGVNYSTTEDLIKLGVGTYNVTITDATGHNCTATLPLPVVISQPSAQLQIASSIKTDLTGFETNNGSIAVTLSGGTPNYKYEWKKDSDPTVINTTSSISNLSIGNYHLTVIDANDCKLPQVDYSITQPDKLQIVSIIQTPNTNINCFGDSPAEFTATVTGGVKEYAFEWLNTTTGAKYSSVETINTTTTISKASNLGAGDYILSITDKYNNIVFGTNTFTITQPEKLAFAYIQKNISCSGDNTGSVKLTITGGTQPYTIISGSGTIDNPNSTISDLIKGTYTVKVIDANGCQTAQQTITIEEPLNSVYIKNQIITPTTGFGLATGSIAITAAGGTPVYTYEWKNNLGTVIGTNSPNLNNVPAGAYSISVIDANGCKTSNSYTIQQPTKPILTEKHLQATCSGLLGSLEATASGGATFDQNQSDRNYTYKLKNTITGNTTVIIGNKANFTNITDGDYSLTATDLGGIDSNTIAITFKQPSPIIVFLDSKSNVNCFGDKDGSIAISVSGGTPLLINGVPKYDYQWKKKNTATNTYENFTPPSLNSFYAGIYAVEVRDANYNNTDAIHCIGILDEIKITEPKDFGFDITKITYVNPSAINGNDGKLHFEIKDGVSKYEYKFYTKASNGSETIITTIPNTSLQAVDFSNLIKNHYYISAKDQTGCIKYADFDFRDNPLTGSINQTQNINCFDANNAVLNVNTEGGFGTKTISWYRDNVLLSSTIVSTVENILNFVKPGAYYAVIRDSNKVEVTSNTINVTQPQPVTFTLTQDPVKCIGDSNGKIILSASGGNGNYIYFYNGSLINNWQNFTNGANTTISDLAEGEYTIQVLDTQQCKSTNATIKVTSPTALSISNIILIPATGNGLSNGSITITPQGANGSYTYKWFKSDNTNIYQTVNTAINLAAGKYYAIITDANGCSLTSPLLEVTEPLLLETNITLQNIISCNGDKNGSIKPTTTGGFLKAGENYTYQWYADGNTAVLATTTVLNTIGKGSYYAIVSDSNGNQAKSKSLLVTEPLILNNTLTSDYTLCGDANDWTITATPSGGTPPYNYIWNTGDKTASLQNVPPGKYNVTVTDNHGCYITKNITITTPVHLATAEVITKPTCFQGSDASIVLTSVGGQPPYSYLWNTGVQSNILSNVSAQKYTVSVTDSKGCVINKAYTIDNPQKEVVNLGNDVTLCMNQSLTINATIVDNKAKYSWTSTKGFTSNQPIITVSEPADYTLVVTNNLGCTASDTVKISSQNTAINAEFAASSQVFLNEKFIIVDISNPIADSIEWILPAEATVVSKNKDYAELSFSKAGEYNLTLNTKKGECTATQTKTIVVTEGEYINPENTDLKKKFDLAIYPNPSNGVFTVDVTLDKIMPAHVKVYNLNNNMIIDTKYEEGKDAYKFDFNINGLTSGVYFVLVESQQGNQLRKIIIK